MVRNPSWSRDELLVTLDFYFSHEPSFPPKGSPPIRELSETLVNLQKKLGGETPEKFRNQNGVYMKLMNFRRCDPTYMGKGLQRGSKLEPEIWNEYSSKADELNEVASAIRAAVSSNEPIPATDDSTEDMAEAKEGRLLTNLHHSRERSPGITQRKKKAALQANGKLTCEVCGFNYAKAYGERGDGFIECHHTKPLSELPSLGTTTRPSDLALVCANCHRMIHKSRPWLSIEELRNLLIRQ